MSENNKRVAVTSRSGGSVRIEPEKPKQNPKQKPATKPEPDKGDR
jgi:hypothetical protein